MALMARSVTQSPVAGAAGPRATASVASFNRTQIEELSSSTSVSFEQSTTLLADDYGGYSGRRQAAVSVVDKRGTGPVPSPTTNETYSAAFRLAEFNGVEVDQKPFVRGAKGYGGLLTKAVGTYETNAKVIHGQMVPRGSQLRVAA